MHSLGTACIDLEEREDCVRLGITCIYLEGMEDCANTIRLGPCTYSGLDYRENGYDRVCMHISGRIAWHNKMRGTGHVQQGTNTDQ